MGLIAKIPLSRRAQLSFLAWVSLTAFGTFYFLADSEFWPMSVAREFGKTPVIHSVLIYKPLFHAILAIPYIFDLSNIQHILFAKALFSAIGSGTFLILFWLNMRFGGWRVATVMAVLLGLSNTYATQFFRIRSDVFSCFFSVLLIGFVLKIRLEWTRQRHLLAGLLAIAVMAVTPKGIFNLVILSGFSWGILRAQQMPKATVAKYIALWFAIFPLCALGIFSLALLPFHIDLSLALSYAAKYFIDSYSAPKIGLGSTDFYFVWRQLHLDAPIWLGIICSWFVLVQQRRRLSPLANGALHSLPLTLAVMFLHNQRLPFFWGGLWPFAVWPLAIVVAHWGYRRQLGLVLLIVLNLVLNWRMAPWWTSNQIQMNRIQMLENFIRSLPDKTVFDGQGILPRSQTVLTFFSPGDLAANRAATDLLEQKLPGTVVYLQKSYLGEPKLSQILDAHYRSVGAAIWINKSFNNNLRFGLEEYWGRWFSFEPPRGALAQ